MRDYIEIIGEAESFDIDRLVEGPGVLLVTLGKELLEKIAAVLELIVVLSLSSGVERTRRRR